MVCITEHITRREGAARCPLCDADLQGTRRPPMCPCSLQRRGECTRCGRPCEHGRWIRVRGCELCGVRVGAEGGTGRTAEVEEAPWIGSLESVEDLSGPDDADVASIDIGAASRWDEAGAVSDDGPGDPQLEPHAAESGAEQRDGQEER
eukprot:10983531-Alexandrium_andersonii.AAC.1